MEGLVFSGGAPSALPWRARPPRVTSASHPPLSVLPPTTTRPLLCCARKSRSNPEPLLKESPAELSFDVEEDADRFDDEELFDDEILEDDDDVGFEDDLELEDEEAYVGDGGEGGGVSLSGMEWDKKALALAEDVSTSLGGDLKIYAFRTSATSIQVRIEKMSNKSGSPSMSDIEAFTRSYQSRLEDAVSSGNIPDNLSLEVSSPGVERVVRIPEDLERFKDRPMYVRYVGEDEATGISTHEGEGIFKLVSFDPDLAYCVWGVADVRANREKAGKGRPLSKKQRDWRLQTAFESLRLVRIYSEC